MSRKASVSSRSSKTSQKAREPRHVSSDNAVASSSDISQTHSKNISTFLADNTNIPHNIIDTSLLADNLAQPPITTLQNIHSVQPSAPKSPLVLDDDDVDFSDVSPSTIRYIDQAIDKQEKAAEVRHNQLLLEIRSLLQINRDQNSRSNLNNNVDSIDSVDEQPSSPDNRSNHKRVRFNVDSNQSFPSPSSCSTAHPSAKPNDNNNETISIQVGLYY